MRTDGQKQYSVGYIRSSRPDDGQGINTMDRRNIPNRISMSIPNAAETKNPDDALMQRPTPCVFCATRFLYLQPSHYARCYDATHHNPLGAPCKPEEPTVTPKSVQTSSRVASSGYVQNIRLPNFYPIVQKSSHLSLSVCSLRCAL